MVISQMVKREDFYNILNNTVSAYYRDVYGKEVCLSYEKADGCDKLYVNEQFGFIAPFPAPKGLKTFLLGEYNIRGSAVKRIVGKAAALSVSKFPWLETGKGRKAYLPKGVLKRNTFIYPQNRSVRFFDYDSMTVDCIIKNGFTDRFFKNQLAFRKETDYDFVLGLVDSGDNWFREKILLGHPLARVTNQTVYDKAITDAMDGIKKLCADTKKYISAESYAETLRQKTDSLISAAKERKKIDTYGITVKMIDDAIEKIKISSFDIPMCKSHGDLQSGNIWVDLNQKTWIYDWETVAFRSVWYDSAVLNYSIRRAYGWQALLGEKTPHKMLMCDERKNYTAEEYEIIKSVVLVEDFIFYLEDMLELPDNWGREIYDNFSERMGKLLIK